MLILRYRDDLARPRAGRGTPRLRGRSRNNQYGATARGVARYTSPLEIGALDGSSLEQTAHGGSRGGERTPVDLAWASRSTSFANTLLPAGAGRQDPAEQVQVKDQGDDEYQAPPASCSAEHNDDDGDPNCQQQPEHQ
jgi:hypothetical protein